MINIDTKISFGSHLIQHTFSAEQNRVVLFGASGSGKSVLLKMIAGFFNPDRGKITIGSHTLFDTSQNIDIPIFRRRIGYLPQEYTLFPNLNVRANILYGIRVQKKNLDKPWFDTLIERLEIGDLLEREPGSLSGGQQQRVALARILIIRPDILLLDEPFSALDSSIRESLRDMVIKLVDELDIKTILVTHDLGEAFVFAKELVLIHQGRVIEAGQRDDLYRRPQFVESARLLGFSNIFPTSQSEPGQALLDTGERFHFSGQFDGSRAFCCIRPEHIMILRPQRSRSKEPINPVEGSVRQCYHHGQYVKLTLAAETGLELQLNIPVHVYDRLKIEAGVSLRVFLKEEAIIMCQSKTEGTF